MLKGTAVITTGSSNGRSIMTVVEYRNVLLRPNVSEAGHIMTYRL